jgi:hypothetical protein
LLHCAWLPSNETTSAFCCRKVWFRNCLVRVTEIACNCVLNWYEAALSEAEVATHSSIWGGHNGNNTFVTKLFVIGQGSIVTGH